MHDAGNGAVQLFRQRIIRFVVTAKAFIDGGNNGTAQGMTGVFAIQETGVIGRNGNWQRSGMTQHGMALVLGKPDDPAQGLEVTDPIADLPLPVMPMFVGDVRIETPSEGLSTGTVFITG